MLLALAGLLLPAFSDAADEPAPAPRIIMLRGGNRSERTARKPTPGTSVAPTPDNTRPSEGPPPAVETPPAREVSPPTTPFRNTSVFRRPAPIVPDFPSPDGSGPPARLTIIEEFSPATPAWKPTGEDVFDTSFPVTDSPPRPPIVFVAPPVPPEDSGDAPIAMAEPATPESAGEDHQPGRHDLAVTHVSATHAASPVKRLSQTAIMKLDPLQSAFIGGGILICLSFQVVIVVILYWQRNQQLLHLLPALAGGEGAIRARMRSTGVADLGADPGLLKGGGFGLQQEWQSAADDHRRQEASIVEEVVSMNVSMAHELTHS